MTDDELAGKLEWNAKHGSHAFPPLLYAAANSTDHYAIAERDAQRYAEIKAARETEGATA